MKRHLKINMDAIEEVGVGARSEQEEGLCAEGVRLGSFLVSSQGVTAPMGSVQGLTLQDLVLLSEAEGGFLGKGSSGSVRRATHRDTGVAMAIKEIKGTSPGHLREIRRELETLYGPTGVEGGAQTSSEHLVDFFGAFAHEGSVFIAMECLDGSLDMLPKPVPLKVLAHMIRSILKGLMYLHRTRHLIHRDLKPSNVLFNRITGDIKISDFGVSSELECTKDGAKSFVGTVTYMSPERLRGDFYSYSADIWSLGLVIAELALGTVPFSDLRGGTTEARFWALLQHLSSPDPALELSDSMDPALAQFITACVAKVPEHRPSCAKLLQYPFITAKCEGGADDESSNAADQRVIREWLMDQRGQNGSDGARGRGGESGEAQRLSLALSAAVCSANNGEGCCEAATPPVRANVTASSSEPSVNLDAELDKLLF